MPSEIELSLILTTFERPKHLERSLASLALQRDMAGRFEVIVADDGSRDRTSNVVERYSTSVDFPLRLTTHPHRGFRVSLCRNDGVRVSHGSYLLFSDSDCIFPPDHLANHLRARQAGVVRAGNCYRLEEDMTTRLDLPAIAAGSYREWVSRQERMRMAQIRFKEKCYQLVRHSSKPKLTGCNIGISREDLEAVNGFDESFVGWGCEDDDLAIRLRKAGKRIISALGYTHAYHMWHPADPTTPAKWNDGLNVERLLGDRPIRCSAGLTQTPDMADGSLNTGVPDAIRRPRPSKYAA